MIVGYLCGKTGPFVWEKTYVDSVWWNGVYMYIYMIVGYLCGKADAQLCVVKQYIYMYMYDSGISVKQAVYMCVCVCIWVYRMVIDKSPSRLLASPVW